MSRIIGHGVDLVECHRIQQLAERYGRRFLERIFTKDELDYCLSRKRKWEHLAGRFAAKEAVLKVLGTGWAGQIAWTHIEIRNDTAGRPGVELSGYTNDLAQKLGVKEILVSISHTSDHAIASAVAVT